MKFNDWTVIGCAILIPKGRSGKHGKAWPCRCVCGTERVVLDGNLRRGLSKNCGCARKSKIGAINRSHGAGRQRLHGSRAASVWLDMHRRCRDISNPNYGGRGISVCLRWCGSDGYNNFLSDMGEPPAGASIDRIDNNAGYSFTNCRWARPVDQQNNTRRNVHGWLNGQRMTAAQIGRAIGKDRSTVAKQIKKGMYGQT